MGGAQPLAATMNGACFLGIDVDAARIEKRVATKYCDYLAHSLDEAFPLIDTARAQRTRDLGWTRGELRGVMPGTGPSRYRPRHRDRSD